ncbi:DMT family transporter [Derxia gummosa]|uniref:DMT family transporter n=1 Tax=Derxia gummosa DSM 723 TaxID=1121388 RepID=A0A8B6X7X0_9BURK|nr:DMT family transporter [Derxia gummosa]
MPSFSTLVFSFFSVMAGVSVALQQVLNSNLRVQLASPWWAGFVSYCVGGIAMLLVALVVPGPQPSLSGLPAAPGGWFSWTSGVFGAVFIATAILMVPRLGAATVLALIVVGQMTGSLAFDHFGLFGLAQRSISPIRLAGVACLLVGVVLVRA